MAGQRVGAFDLYALRGNAARVRRVTKTPPFGVSWFTAQPGVIVAANDIRRQSFSNLDVVNLSRLPGLPGRSLGFGQSPALARDRRHLAYQLPADVAGHLGAALFVADLSRPAAKRRFILKERLLIGMAWTPSGALAATVARHGRIVLVLDADGRDRREVPVSGRYTVQPPEISRAGDIAVQTQQRLVIFSPTGRMLQQYSGPWHLLSWAPDGRSLLVATSDGAQLGLLSLATHHVRPIGHVTGGFAVQASWLAP